MYAMFDVDVEDYFFLASIGAFEFYVRVVGVIYIFSVVETARAVPQRGTKRKRSMQSNKRSQRMNCIGRKKGT